MLPSIARIFRAKRDESFAKTVGHLGTESSARTLNSTPAPAISRRDLRPSAASRGATIGNRGVPRYRPRSLKSKISAARKGSQEWQQTIQFRRSGRCVRLGKERCLTPRSSGAPTARHQARSVACFILHSPGLASCRRRPLSSNVRRREAGLGIASRVSAFGAN